MDEERAMLRQRVSEDLPHLTNYYLELSSEQGPGILVVNYYPEPDPDEPENDSELGIQCEARFLKTSQIPKFIEDVDVSPTQPKPWHSDEAKEPEESDKYL